MIGKIFVAGIGILISAIIINLVAMKIGLHTWYDVFQKKKIHWYEYIFLVFVYPLLLGLIAYIILT